MNQTVDIVVTWVQNSPALRRNVSALCHFDPARYRNLHTFRFALRSWLRYLPWVRFIWVVTPAPPCWLRAASGRVRVVPHHAFWPVATAARDLPTYNSLAIEAHLHRIAGLSETFVYMNDDMLIGRPLPPTYFFDRLGRPVLDKPKAVKPALRAGPNLLMLSHGPYAMRKSLAHEVQRRWPGWFAELSRSRCREGLKPPFWAYQWYALHEAVAAPYHRDGVHFVCCGAERNALPIYERLLATRPSVIVINDDFITSAEVAQMQEFLETYYGWHASEAEDYGACALHVDQRATPSSLDTLELGHVGEGSSPRMLGPRQWTAGAAARVVFLNAMRGYGSARHCAMLRGDPALRGAAVVLLNELDLGMARTRNRNVAHELARCLHMNYVYGVEFKELTLGQPHEKKRLPPGAANAQGLHGNAILSVFPLRQPRLLRLPGAPDAYWRKGGFDGEFREGGRMAVLAQVPVARGAGVQWVELVATHLDFFVGEAYNSDAARRIVAAVDARGADAVVVAGDMGSRGRQSRAMQVFAAHGYALDFNYRLKGASGDWVLVRNLSHEGAAVVHAPLSDHNFLRVDVRTH